MIKGVKQSSSLSPTGNQMEYYCRLICFKIVPSVVIKTEKDKEIAAVIPSNFENTQGMKFKFDSK